MWFRGDGHGGLKGGLEGDPHTTTPNQNLAHETRNHLAVTVRKRTLVATIDQTVKVLSAKTHNSCEYTQCLYYPLCTKVTPTRHRFPSPFSQTTTHGRYQYSFALTKKESLPRLSSLQIYGNSVQHVIPPSLLSVRVTAVYPQSSPPFATVEPMEVMSPPNSDAPQPGGPTDVSFISSLSPSPIDARRGAGRRHRGGGGGSGAVDEAAGDRARTGGLPLPSVGEQDSFRQLLAESLRCASRGGMASNASTSALTPRPTRSVASCASGQSSVAADTATMNRLMMLLRWQQQQQGGGGGGRHLASAASDAAGSTATACGSQTGGRFLGGRKLGDGVAAASLANMPMRQWMAAPGQQAATGEKVHQDRVVNVRKQLWTQKQAALRSAELERLFHREARIRSLREPYAAPLASDSRISTSTAAAQPTSVVAPSLVPWWVREAKLFRAADDGPTQDDIDHYFALPAFMRPLDAHMAREGQQMLGKEAVGGKITGASSTAVVGQVNAMVESSNAEQQRIWEAASQAAFDDAKRTVSSRIASGML